MKIESCAITYKGPNIYVQQTIQ